ncbi:ATP-binding protein involved in chromosome partitioning [Tessaracoccus bendigoensis DSM 12906]|uniref:Iron-sulfur cluster carrier protein n=1 Tax=Tessaracoccus bendigoensis DSM 12906 TaxID=1123357 RepID=A0A1M6EXW1_9ACTN|nr:P-loop NTPase [Tessaracoccus bendigoensis]SHI90265.1 ATP-binding protein involved in chromosome partitioning [Tessaracoccus bendigoensis DSM 12906]
MSEHPLLPLLRAALHEVEDPEIRRPITDLGMVDDLRVDDTGAVSVRVLLTVSGCPMRSEITTRVTDAVAKVEGVTAVDVELGVMDDEQRQAMRNMLRGGKVERLIPFAQPGNLTRVIAVASGKGGVGKSSVTVNLALALAAQGRSVGILDADIYGHSVPDLLGLGDARPTVVDDMILPVPAARGLKVISVGMLKPSRDQVVAWRGPILDRALTQLLADVYWGDLDYLLLDLPPGTGDVAMSLGQKIPDSEVIVVTTPQPAASEVAERAGTMAHILEQRVLGVVENMSWLESTCPHCGGTHRVELFGAGGGQSVADALTDRLVYEVPLLAQIPFDEDLLAGGDRGTPIVDAHPEHPASEALTALATEVAGRKRGLVGQRLPLSTP